MQRLFLIATKMLNIHIESINICNSFIRILVASTCAVKNPNILFYL